MRRTGARLVLRVTMAFAIVLAMLLPQRHAHAQALIALSGTGDDASLFEQLRLDLSMLGFAVESHANTASLADLHKLARARGAAAAIWLEPVDPDARDVWIVDRMTGKTVQRRYPRSSLAREDAARVLSQQIIELLRASFRELDYAAAPPLAPVAAPPVAVARLIEKPGPRLAMSVAAAYLDDAGGAGDSRALFAQVRVGGRLALGLEACVPLSAATLTGPEGEASLRPWGFSVSIARILGEWRRRVRPDVGVSLGLLRLVTTGRAQAPYVSADDSLWRPLLTVRAGARVALGFSGFGLRADVLAGAALPAARVDFGLREAATWGLPFVMLAAGFDWSS